jgi:hypothetical protein
LHAVIFSTDQKTPSSHPAGQETIEKNISGGIYMYVHNLATFSFFSMNFGQISELVCDNFDDILASILKISE